MITIQKTKSKKMVLKPASKIDVKKNKLIKKQKFDITEFLDQNLAYIYLEKVDCGCNSETKKFIATLFAFAKYRDFQINLEDFDFDQNILVEDMIISEEYQKVDFMYFKKHKQVKINIDIITNKDFSKLIKKTRIIGQAKNLARKYQAMPPNELNSENFATFIEKDLKKHNNLNLQIFKKKKIEGMKMGLFLAVNKGSMFEPRMVRIDYNGDSQSNKRTVFVGKGIMFDSGGYNLKPSKHMCGMKYDMSGAAIVASTMKTIAQLKPKGNFSALMMLTDNRINGDANLPDSIWFSMNGKSVEVNNTDAEGRLVLADGITYAIRNLKATRIIDVATLTGAIIASLGNIYTGTWATSDKLWENFLNTAKISREKIWRMPFDKAFSINIKKSEYADLKNTDYSGKGGANSAAMFLKEFIEQDVEYIHLDIAGTADIDDKPTGVMIKTLTEFALSGK